MTRTAADKARRKAVQEAKDAAPREGCPTPDKRAYRRGEALHMALRRSGMAGRPLRIYRCVCGSLHLTSKVHGRLS